MHLERLADPPADRLMSLERVVHHDLRRERPLDHGVGLGEPRREVAALVGAHVDQLPGCDGLVGIEPRLELLPLDLDERGGGARLAQRVGADGGNSRALVVALVRESLALARADRAPDSGSAERRPELDAGRTRMGVRAAHDHRVQHPGKLHVGGEEHLAAHPAEAVLAWSGAPDHVAGAGRPLLERILVDDEPDLLEAALDLLLGADQSRHVRIASSIFG